MLALNTNDIQVYNTALFHFVGTAENDNRANNVTLDVNILNCKLEKKTLLKSSTKLT